jgi:hypothetical protein
LRVPPAAHLRERNAQRDQQEEQGVARHDE